MQNATHPITTPNTTAERLSSLSLIQPFTNGSMVSRQPPAQMIQSRTVSFNSSLPLHGRSVRVRITFGRGPRVVELGDDFT